MKKIILLLSILVSSNLFSQKITSDNYYDSYVQFIKGNKLTTAWLTELETAQILEDEMKKAGFEWISKFRIIKLDNGEIVNSICFSEKSKVGFLFEGMHALPNKSRRNIKSMNKENLGYDYAEKIVSLNGESDFIKVQTVPDNLFILKNDPYWYQFTETPQSKHILVDKETIIEILRNDIRKVFANFKK